MLEQQDWHKPALVHAQTSPRCSCMSTKAHQIDIAQQRAVEDACRDGSRQLVLMQVQVLQLQQVAYRTRYGPGELPIWMITQQSLSPLEQPAKRRSHTSLGMGHRLADYALKHSSAKFSS